MNTITIYIDEHGRIQAIDHPDDVQVDVVPDKEVTPDWQIHPPNRFDNLVQELCMLRKHYHKECYDPNFITRHCSWSRAKVWIDSARRTLRDQMKAILKEAGYCNFNIRWESHPFYMMPAAKDIGVLCVYTYDWSNKLCVRADGTIRSRTNGIDPLYSQQAAERVAQLWKRLNDRVMA